MTKSVITVLTLALLVGGLALGLQPGAARTAMAQKPKKVADRVEQALKTKEPGWKLARKMGSEVTVIHQWKFRGEEVGYSITEHASPEAAAESFEFTASTIAVGGPTELKGIGDKAYLWPGDSRRSTALHFRKDNVHVALNAPSVTLAKRFARHIEKEIDDK